MSNILIKTEPKTGAGQYYKESYVRVVFHGQRMFNTMTTSSEQ